MQGIKTLFFRIFQSLSHLLPKPPPPLLPSSHATLELEMQPCPPSSPPPPPPSLTTTLVERQPPPPPSPSFEMLPLSLQPPATQQLLLPSSINLDPELGNISPDKTCMHWQNIVLAFCFTSALEIALQYAGNEPKVTLPYSIYFLSSGITIVFSSLFVSKSIANKFPSAASTLDKFAIFLAVSTFFFAISIPMPRIFKCAVGALYFISLLIIATCNSL